MSEAGNQSILKGPAESKVNNAGDGDGQVS